MMRKTWIVIVLALLAVAQALAQAPAADQPAKAKGILTGKELSKVVPESFFFHGQLAPTQKRNSAAVRTQDDHIWMAALVDTSGYSADIAERMQGFLITETALSINGISLSPGAYAIGSDKDGNLIVQDLGWNGLMSVATEKDSEMPRPTPLQITRSGEGWRLYLGRRYVEVKAG